MSKLDLPGPYTEVVIRDEDVPAEMVWVDYETTGLSPRNEIPLEVGVLVTDRGGNERASFRSLILTPNWEMFMVRADPFVVDMHTKNGLAEDLRKTNQMMPNGTQVLSPQAVDGLLFDFLHESAGPARQHEMCGSTINFDRNFMDAYMPNSHGWFHYRNIDISSVRNLCKLHNPPVYEARKKQLEGFEAKHRVLDDIRASIDEYKFYVDNFLFAG